MVADALSVPFNLYFFHYRFQFLYITRKDAICVVSLLSQLVNVVCNPPLLPNLM